MWFHCRVIFICIIFYSFLADSSRYHRLIDWSQLSGRLLPHGPCNRCGPTEQFLSAAIVHNCLSFCLDHHSLGERGSKLWPLVWGAVGWKRYRGIALQIPGFLLQCESTGIWCALHAKLNQSASLVQEEINEFLHLLVFLDCECYRNLHVFDVRDEILDEPHYCS